MSFPNFLDLRFLPVKDAEAVILPIPYEATTTYGSGTREAPEAILAASRQVELWDEEDGWDPSAAVRLATAAPLTAEVSGPQAMLDKIRKNVQAWVAQGKVVLALGGEHTITMPLVQSVQTKYPDLQIVALDAHADMRDSYDGSKLSHACALKRVYDLGRPLTTLGVRSYSQEESQLDLGGAALQDVQGQGPAHPGGLGQGRRTPAGPCRPGLCQHRRRCFRPRGDARGGDA